MDVETHMIEKSTGKSLGFKPGIDRSTLRYSASRRQPRESRVKRLLRLKAEDANEKWKNPTAAIMHSALKAAVSAVPFGGWVFDSEFLERVVQEAYPDWHARASDHPTWTASERLALSNKMLAAVQVYATRMAGQRRHPQQTQAKQWLEQMQQRQKQIRLQLASDLRAKKPTPQKTMQTNILHISRAPQARQTASRTVYRSQLTAEHLKAIPFIRQALRPEPRATKPQSQTAEVISLDAFRKKIKPANRQFVPSGLKKTG